MSHNPYASISPAFTYDSRLCPSYDAHADVNATNFGATSRPFCYSLPSKHVHSISTDEGRRTTVQCNISARSRAPYASFHQPINYTHNHTAPYYHAHMVAA